MFGADAAMPVTARQSSRRSQRAGICPFRAGFFVGMNGSITHLDAVVNSNQNRRASRVSKLFC
jgi:hypothetical protein